MPVQLQFEIEGEVQLSRRLLIAAEGVKTFDEPLENISKEVLRSFDENFDSRGSLFGGWAPRASTYKADWPLLEKSGDLRSGFDAAFTSQSVTFGNAIPYFKYHQSKQARSKLPRRVMMKLDQQRKNYIIKEFQKYLIKITRTRV